MKTSLCLLAAFAIFTSISSCSKCVQCTARDKYGIVINTSAKICEPDFSRNQFIDRYNTNFKDYNPVCLEVAE